MTENQVRNRARKHPLHPAGRAAGVTAFAAGIGGAPACDPATAVALAQFTTPGAAAFNSFDSDRRVAWMVGWQDGWTTEHLAAVPQ